MKTGLVIGLVAVLIGLVFIGIVIKDRNQLVFEREEIKKQFAQIDGAMQRRADLIPQLVNTIKGATKQELAIIKDITDARAGFSSAATPQDKIQKFSSMERGYRILIENYPQFKSDENFLRLQDSLEGSENRVLQERRKYNEVVARYNEDIQFFPKNIAASLFGFQREDAYFKPEPDARKMPQVSF